MNIALIWNCFVIRKRNLNKFQYFLFVCLIQGSGTLTVLNVHIGVPAVIHHYTLMCSLLSTTTPPQKPKRRKHCEICVLQLLGILKKKCYHQLLFFLSFARGSKEPAHFKLWENPQGLIFSQVLRHLPSTVFKLRSQDSLQ